MLRDMSPITPRPTFPPTDAWRCSTVARCPTGCRGSAVFADISGFTPLTEALAGELGPQRGSEELTANLNRVFHAVIAELHRFGGDVIYFSGDAVTCWIEGDDGARAVASAVAMQEAMERSRPHRDACRHRGAARHESRRRRRRSEAIPRRRPGHPADRRPRRAARGRPGGRGAPRREGRGRARSFCGCQPR